MKLRPVLIILAVIAMGVVLFLPADVRADSLPGLDDTCLETQLQNCSVLASGYIGDGEGPRIAFQTQDGFTEEDGVKGGVVLFSEDETGWSLFARAFDGYRYDVPRLAAGEAIMLHVPGYAGGTGAYNADLLFVRDDSGAAPERESWRAIDLDAWRRDIGGLLPEGHEIWKGVDYDFGDWFYGQLNARTPLWRADDGNCCPSGGWATIHFAIDDDVLVATGVDYQPPAKRK